MGKLKFVLGLMIVYLPYQAKFPQSFEAIKGLNTINVLVLIAFGLMWRLHVRAPESAPAKRAFGFLFVMLTWGLLAGWISDSSQWAADITAWKNAIFYLLLFFIFHHAAQDKKTIRQLLVLVMFIAFMVCVQSVRQGIDYGFGVYNETKRASGPFGPDFRDSNRAAAFLVMFVPVFLAVGLFAKSRWFKLLSLGCFVLGLLAVFVTYSRQAFGIMAVLAFLVAFRRNLIIFAIVGVAIANYDAWVPEGVVNRIAMTNTSEYTEERQLDESTESRFIIWEGAAQLMSDAPWGIGLNHFKREIGQYVPPSLAGYDAHNVYILIATETSVVGAIALVLLLLRLLWFGLRLQADGDPEARMIGVAYTAAVMGAILGNLYGSRLFDGDVTGNFWILSGLVARYLSLRTAERATETAPAPAELDAAGGMRTQHW